MEASDFVAIKHWKEEERPREKLLARGPGALTNAELLAILIHAGTRNYSALDIAKFILERSNDCLRDLGRLDIHELMEARGVGTARAITIAAALELGRRRQVADAGKKPEITSSKEAALLIAPMLADLSSEAFCVLYLNQANMLIRREMHSNGGLVATITDIRVILKRALLLHATKMIVAHNHPSGNPKPSTADKKITTRLREAGRIMDIDLLDHLIIAGNKTFSMADEGLI